MSVKITLHKYFQDFANGLEVVEAQGNTIVELIDDLNAQYPGMKEQLLDNRGRLQGFVEIFVNAENVYPEDTKHPVNDGDELEILTIVSGG